MRVILTKPSCTSLCNGGASGVCFCWQSPYCEFHLNTMKDERQGKREKKLKLFLVIELAVHFGSIQNVPVQRSELLR